MEDVVVVIIAMYVIWCLSVLFKKEEYPHFMVDNYDEEVSRIDRRSQFSGVETLLIIIILILVFKR